MTELSDYTTNGDTWHLTNHDCASCNRQYASNGSVYKCVECGHWEVIDA